MPDMELTNIDEILEKVKSALEKRNYQEAVKLLEPLRPSDQATVFDDLQPEEQDELLPRLDPQDSADILEELEEDEAAVVATRQDSFNLAEILEHMEPDEAADLLGDIEPHQANDIISAMKEPEEIIPLLSYDDDSAGGMMTSIEFTLDEEMTAQDAIEHLRKISPDSETAYYMFVTDQKDRLIGVVSMRELVVAQPSMRVVEFMNEDVLYIKADADQEEASRLMLRYDLLALPVVDETKHLIGVITYDDMMDVLDEEATEDIFRLGGVPQSQPIQDRIPTIMKTRLPWLALNLITAMASATVLSLFESTIAQVAVLAAFFPIVAGVSGSAATQTLTVTVRGMALGEINLKDALPTLTREMLVGLVNGLSIGILVAVIAYFWKGAPMLGLVVGSATLLNMVAAGLAGVIVPMLMERLKFDPALASPILVTTTTDTLGYLIYLGLATAMIQVLL